MPSEPSDRCQTLPIWSLDNRYGNLPSLRPPAMTPRRGLKAFNRLSKVYLPPSERLCSTTRQPGFTVYKFRLALTEAIRKKFKAIPDQNIRGVLAPVRYSSDRSGLPQWGLQHSPNGLVSRLAIPCPWPQFPEPDLRCLGCAMNLVDSVIIIAALLP